MDKVKEIIKYYIIFFKIGLFTIGGGYTMLPIIEKEVVEKNKWVSEEEVMDSYALAQSIPGVIAVNTATLIGSKLSGFFGALAAVLGVITPSIIIIIIVAIFFNRFIEITEVANAFRGIRIAVLSLLMATTYKMTKKTIKDIAGIVLAISSFICVMFLNVSPIYVIIASAVISIIFYYRKEKDNVN
jgi:chromate transporter